MRVILQIVSWAALVATIVPSVLFLAGQMTLDQSKWALLAATVLWFVAAPLWMGRGGSVAEELVL
jgi:hypothetical protein